MRFVIYGAGAVGGVIGVRLTEHGHKVILIGRENQRAAIRERGLTLESPASITTVQIEIVTRPAEIQWTAEDVVLMTMKTQDTQGALQDLAVTAPARLPVVCAQNAVENERLALRYFDKVYGICVMCPCSYLTPGVVQSWCAPVTGILDIGRYPAGIDEISKEIASVLGGSNFVSEPRADIMRWKYGKLLMNLGNAAEALCGRSVRGGHVVTRARAEAIACFKAVGIDYVSDAEDEARRGDILQIGVIEGRARAGGSSWQSLRRQTGRIEADYLNGEIAMLGRSCGVATPVNSLLQRLANQFASEGRPPGSMALEELSALVGQEEV